MSLPDWLAVYASLGDDALAVLANPGLVRRARRAVGRLRLCEATAEEVVLAWDEVELRLRPGGPTQASCRCPVAGICVHLVGGCLWARVAVAEALGAGGDLAAAAVGEGGASARDGGLAEEGRGREPAAVVGGRLRAADDDLVEEVLGWEPAAVNQAVGVAAVRRVAQRLRPVSGGPLDPELAATPLDAKLDLGQMRGCSLRLAWPGAPAVVVVPGAGVAGMLVDGDHAAVAERAWKLEAVVRLFAAHGRGWPWPAEACAGVPRARQQAAAALVTEVIECLVAEGVSRVVRAGADRLSRAGQQARLEDLSLLARLVDAATGLLRRLMVRSDEVAISAVAAALAQAWANARTVLSGSVAQQAAEGSVPARLVPLAARWWLSPSGSRGLTLHAWDPDAGRLEEVTDARAAGTDPGFVRGWDTSLLWGASASRLCSGVLTLNHPRRREDGTLSASAATTVISGGWEEVDLTELSEQVNAAVSGPARTAFGVFTQPVRIVLPRRNFGLGALEIDEIGQQIVWPVTDRAGRAHRLVLPAEETNLRLLTWLLQQPTVLAVVCVGIRPEAAFLPSADGMRLVSLSLTPLPLDRLGASWRRRLLRLDAHRRASGPARELNQLERLCAAVSDVVDDLMASGTRDLGHRHRDTLTRRIPELENLGLHTLAAAAATLLDDSTAARLLWARFVLDRLGVLLN